MAFIDELREKQRTDTTVKDIQDEFASWFEERIQTYVKSCVEKLKKSIITRVEKGEKGTLKGEWTLSGISFEDMPKLLAEKIKKYNVPLSILGGCTTRDGNYNSPLWIKGRAMEWEIRQWTETKGAWFWKKMEHYYEYKIALTAVQKE